VQKKVPFDSGMKKNGIGPFLLAVGIDASAPAG
jgi:hypothetical protein